MRSGVWSRDSGVDVRIRCSGRCSATAVSAAGTWRVSGVRTHAQRCRRRQFAPDRLRIGRARGVQHLRVTAHVVARATDQPNPGVTSQTQTSPLASCFGPLRLRTGLRIDGQRTFGHEAFSLRPPTSWTSSPGGRPAVPSGHRGVGIASFFRSRNPGHARSPDDFGAGMIWGMVR